MYFSPEVHQVIGNALALVFSSSQEVEDGDEFDWSTLLSSELGRQEVVKVCREVTRQYWQPITLDV